MELSNTASRSCTKKRFVPDGKVNIEVKYQNQHSTEEMYIVPDKYDSLLERTWIRHLKVKLHELDNGVSAQTKPVTINSICSSDQIMTRFQEIFTQKVGCVPKLEVSLRLRKDVKPVFHKHREVLDALRQCFEKESDELEAAGIISKISTSDWELPLVIPKPMEKYNFVLITKSVLTKNSLQIIILLKNLKKFLIALRGC